MSMDKTFKNVTASDEHAYELKDVDSKLYHTHYDSANYETLDTINSDTMRNTHEQGNSAGCDSSDDHNIHLLKPDISNKTKLLFRVVKVSFVALLLVALAVVVFLFLTSRTKELQECASYTEIPNGKVVNFTGSKHGDTLQIECNSASKLVGPNIVTCYSSNQWSDYPRCILKQCNDFVPPNHGFVFKNTSSVVGATVSITCKDGYARNGHETVVCQSNETWSMVPTCEPVDCGFPKNITNGEFNDFRNTTYKSKFLVICSNGYKLIGQPTVVCKIDKNWSDMPTCEPVSCGLPGIPKNGHIKYLNGITFGSEAHLSCDENFSIEGNTKISCKADGKWMTLPTCERNDNGTAQCSCRGNWNVLSDIKPGSCGIPSIPRNGYLEIINGTAASMACAEGFAMIGNADILCLRNGSWSWIPKCLPISCGLPEKPLNGTVDVINGTTYQKTASIKCNTGFILTGPPVVKCLSNGKWTQGAICTPTATDCYDIHIRSNTTPSGIYNVTLWESKQVIQVYCDMDTDGGGWTVFQNRFDGSVDFFNNYAQYENGFGNLTSEFWLGLKHIHEMSTQGRTKMRIVISAANGATTYTQFLIFYLSSEENGYMLNFGGVSGCRASSRYSKIQYHNGIMFSTYDYSNYGNPGTSAAIQYHGGWWYSPSTSATSNLNGRYAIPGSSSNEGMFYSPFQSRLSLKTSKMMFKRF